MIENYVSMIGEFLEYENNSKIYDTLLVVIPFIGLGAYIIYDKFKSKKENKLERDLKI